MEELLSVRNLLVAVLIALICFGVLIVDALVALTRQLRAFGDAITHNQSILGDQLSHMVDEIKSKR